MVEEKVTRKLTTILAADVEGYIWTIGELVEAATNPETVPLRHAPFTVIDGGLSVQR